MIPGEMFFDDTEIELNAARQNRTLRVDNTGDRPIQVGSHTHFFEVNRALKFDRIQALGFRLNIPSGTAVRFEPGQGTEVELVELGGSRKVYGMNNLVMGTLDGKSDEIIKRAKEQGFIE